MVSRCVIFVFFIFLNNGFILAEEPNALTKLRQSWQQALQKGSSKVYENYMNELSRIRSRYERKPKAIEFIDAEIYRASSMSRSHGPVPLWGQSSLIPEVKKARETCQQEMLQMIRKKNDIYRKALTTLEQKLKKDFDDKGAKQAGEELAYFKRINGNAKMEAFSSLPRNAAQLQAYLTNSTWEVNEDNGKKGIIKLRPENMADMPWHEARWTATGLRGAELHHHKGSWKFKMSFSPDLRTIEVERRGEVKWSGKRIE